MKAIDCKKCRSNIHKEEKELFLKSQYAMLKDAAYTFACYATVAVIAVQVRRGRSKDYIQKLFDEMVAIYDMPTVFGKELRMTDLMKQFNCRKTASCQADDQYFPEIRSFRHEAHSPSSSE